MAAVNRFRIPVIVLLVLHAVLCFGQAPDTTKPNFFTNLQVEAKFNAGFLWAHSPVVVYLEKNHTTAYEVSVSRPVSGRKPWHCYYNDAIVGVSFMHYNMGNTELLGTANGFYGFARFNLLGRKNAHLRFGLGSGAAWLSKTFDKDYNHKNVTIGSHINCLVNFQLLYDQRITKHLYINAGLSLTHFSNGAFKTPNLGLNLPAFTLGALYRLQPTKCAPLYGKSEFSRHHGFIYSVIATVGRKEIYPPTGRGYATFGLMFNILKPIGIKSGLLLTLEAFNDRSIPATMRHNDPNVSLGYFQAARPGIALGYHVWLGNLAFLFQAGVYPYTYYKGDGRIYSRLGWRYQLPYGLVANLTLKTHFAKADNIEFGIGYTLFNRKPVVRLL